MSFSGATPLLERRPELEALRLHLARIGRDGGVAVIAGASGIGKTRLLGAARREAAGAGVAVLSARCSPLERGFGFGVARQLLEPVLGELGPRAALEGPAALAAPLLGAAGGAIAAPAAEPSQAELDALRRLALAAAGGRPTALLVDDLQWCDEPSLRFLAYLSRRLHGAGLGIVATLTREADGGGGRLERELAGDPEALVLTLGPLGERATGDLLAIGLGRMPEPGF